MSPKATGKKSGYFWNVLSFANSYPFGNSAQSNSWYLNFELRVVRLQCSTLTLSVFMNCLHCVIFLNRSEKYWYEPIFSGLKHSISLGDLILFFNDTDCLELNRLPYSPIISCKRINIRLQRNHSQQKCTSEELTWLVPFVATLIRTNLKTAKQRLMFLPPRMGACAVFRVKNSPCEQLLHRWSSSICVWIVSVWTTHE